MESGQNFQRLPELHALACGLKALVTQEVAEAIDVLRRACGGHGFMASSNLPRLWGLVTAACTYEGENTVLQLQVNHFSFHNSQCMKITQNGPKTGGSHQLISSHRPNGSAYRPDLLMHANSASSAATPNQPYGQACHLLV